MLDILNNEISKYVNLETLNELSKLTKSSNTIISKKFDIMIKGFNEKNLKFIEFFEDINFDLNKINGCKKFNDINLKVVRFREILDSIIEEIHIWYKEYDSDDDCYPNCKSNCNCTYFKDHIDYSYQDVETIIEIVVKYKYAFLKLCPKVQELFDALNLFIKEFGFELVCEDYIYSCCDYNYNEVYEITVHCDFNIGGLNYYYIKRILAAIAYAEI
uniref:Uncharacterized protein n=1 Tax=Pithovirus LCDPAC02 TaxID=2506601 RepID=A0A481YP13_9VIRU|nr:MAG: hypothetical protein LCDPAC02_00680 [Pithovirus LCDPAC02]